MNACFDYDSESAHKLLSDNRDLYLRQSAETVTGRVAPFPSTRAALYAAEQSPQDPIPCYADRRGF